MIVPSRDFWIRAEFLRARKKQMEAHENGEMDCLCDDPAFAGAIETVIDMGDDIVCDSCNAEILSEIITLVQFGRRAVCEGCYQKWHAEEPLEYRRLREDGSLGDVVEKIR